jgi:glycerophosphoryl diester phosphodiesterase
MTDRLPIRPPVIVRHMAATDPPSVPNSLEAIRACLEAHAEFVEVDVTALADRDYLLVHDSQLEAETNGRGPVAACTAERARELRFVRDGQPIHVKVPVLSDVVALFREHPGPTRLQLDYKDMTPFPSDEPLQRLVELISPLGDRVIVSSGADWQLRRLRRLAPWLDLGLDIHFYLDWHPPGARIDPTSYPRQRGAYGYWDDHPLAAERHGDTARYLADRCGMLLGLVPGASTFYVNHRFLVRSLDDGFNWAAELHDQGIKLDAWTLDADNPIAAANAPRLLAAGVDQFTTNTPEALRRLLDKRTLPL